MSHEFEKEMSEFKGVVQQFITSQEKLNESLVKRLAVLEKMFYIAIGAIMILKPIIEKVVEKFT